VELTGIENLIDTQNFFISPNPANEFAMIQFSLLHPSQVNVSVFDVNGKEIETLMNDQLQQEEMSAGSHSLQLNTSEFPKGVYLVRIICDEESVTRKLMVQ
jgi:hypothetical protein